MKPDHPQSVRYGQPIKPPGAVAYVCTGKIPKRNALLALVVGCLLTIANQYEVLNRGPYTPALAVKIFLNFVIPFLVSSVSTAVNR